MVWNVGLVKRGCGLVLCWFGEILVGMWRSLKVKGSFLLVS